MLTVTIVNTGDHPLRPEYGHYTYTVAVNRTVIAQGAVKDHRRDDGWERLVERVVQREVSQRVVRPCMRTLRYVAEVQCEGCAAGLPHDGRSYHLDTRAEKDLLYGYPRKLCTAQTVNALLRGQRAAAGGEAPPSL